MYQTNTSEYRTDIGMKVRHRDTKPQQDGGDVCPVVEEKVRLAQLLEKGCTNMSMHGLPHVYKAPSMHRRVAWLFVVLIGLGFLVWQLTMSLLKYLSWPVESSVYVVSPGRLPLPAITFCNLNPVRRSALIDVPESGAALHRMFGMGLSNGDIIPEYDDIDYGEDPNMGLRRTLTSSLSMLSFNERMVLGHNITDMLVNCTFNGMRCKASNFSLFPNAVYGNCYTFNTFGDMVTQSDIEWKNLEHVSKVGPLYAFEVTIFVQQDEYISLTEEVGIRVIVHNQTEAPFPDSKGFTVSVGESTYVSLKRKEQIRAAYPYGTCGETVNSNMYTDGRQYLAYSQEACRLTCYQAHVIEICGCGDPYYPIDATAFDYLTNNGQRRISPCTEGNGTLCNNDVLNDFAFNRLNCSDECPPVCQETTHDVTISTAHWPSDTVQNDLRRGIFNRGLLQGNTADKEREFIIKNFLKLRIYFGELSSHVTETKSSYSETALLSDLGGLLGLYLGLSIITIFEFVELLMDMCRLCWTKRQPKRGPEKDRPI